MLRGNKAIVTGGSRGIGFAIAKKLSAAGCEVVITGRNAETLKCVASDLGSHVHPIAWDALKLDEIGKHFNEAIDLLGGVDIVVNNAGLFAQINEWDRMSLLQMTIDEWERVMKVNSSALVFTMQEAVKYMLKNNIKGNILNITSVASQEPVYGAYGASKTVSTALTRGWGKMYAADGIVINGIAPGPVATEMNNWHEGDSMKHSRIPFGRFATIDEVGNLAMYLLSKEAEMVCGETVILDGAYAVR